ncbi:MAG: type II toxin-antitoxin system mRNA interferase toxin, RelE/StbE family [Candidatus Wallbacteria bacterium]|nr:type II toxin-antitoxin system mRNA interferase toxin, RelE/StbE family [Candidatus Wallbacteria bacterium]
MKIFAYQKFRKLFRNLPDNIQKKAEKQIKVLSQNIKHPSLQTKKIKGTDGIWEARVDDSYRMTFEIIEDSIYLRVIGSHDESLKNP